MSKIFKIFTLSFLFVLLACEMPLNNQMVDSDSERAIGSVTGGYIFKGKEDLHLSEITIPGTHNSYMYKENRNQNWNLPSQFSYGIRSIELDIHKVRISNFPWYKWEIRTAHGIHNTGGFNMLGGTTPIGDILQDILNFLQDNPGELLFIKWEYHSDGYAWSVTWNEIANEIVKAGLGNYIYYAGDEDPLVQDLLDSGKRLIFPGSLSSGKSGISVRQSASNLDNIWDLENFDSPGYTSGSSETVLHLLQTYSTTDVTGIGNNGEAKSINKKDFLVRFMQRAWLWNGHRPSYPMTDFCDAGDLTGAVNQINSYNVYKGEIENLPINTPVFWTLTYKKDSSEIIKYGRSYRKFNFPGNIDYKGAIYGLETAKPCTISGTINRGSYSGSTRGEVYCVENIYTYQQGGGISSTYVNNASYYVKNIDTGLYLDVQNSSNDDGAKIQGWGYNGSNAQKWTFSTTGNYIFLDNVSSGKKMNLNNPQGDPYSSFDEYFGRSQYNERGHFENAEVHQYADREIINNEWYPARLADGSIVFFSHESGKVLTIPDSAMGTKVITKEMGSFGQRWELVSP